MADREDEVVIDGPEHTLPMGEDMLMEGKGEPSTEEETPKPSMDDMILDGEDVPERIRGKSAREAATYARQLESALKDALAAREERYERPVPQAPAARQEPDPADTIPQTRLQEMLASDPAQAQQAIEIMIQRALRPRDENYSRRASGLVDSMARTAEESARSKYPLEFSALKREIEEVVSQIPDKTGLTSPDGWDRVIAYVRGAHIDKFDEARNRARAQSREADAAGPSMRSSSRPRQASSGTITDPMERKIMQGFDFDPDDPASIKAWNRWKGAR